MKKFLIPATLLIASTLGSAAFAGSALHAREDSLYGQPNPFAAVEAPAARQNSVAQGQGPRLDAGSQQASAVYVPRQSGAVYIPQHNWDSRFHFNDPE